MEREIIVIWGLLGVTVALAVYLVIRGVERRKEKNELLSTCVAMEEILRESYENLRLQRLQEAQLFQQTVEALHDTVDAKDSYTGEHSRRVAEYARMLASRMGKREKEQEEIYRAALLHDVGKIRVPESVILKPDKLTEEEYALIKMHPVTGYHILQKISYDKLLAVGAGYHHERYDGKGYPHGLRGEHIPEMGRIIGVADAYDAMTSNRSYRNILPQDTVRREIAKGRGKQFDPAVADMMLQMIDEDKEYRMRQNA